MHKNSTDTIIADFGFSFDVGSQLTSQTRDATTVTYGHDNLGQVTSASSGQSYSYDRNGNRTMTGYTTGTRNQYVTDPNWVNEYDPEGNLLLRENRTDGTVWKYLYDNLNRLIYAQHENAGATPDVRVEYRYDILGDLTYYGVINNPANAFSLPDYKRYTSYLDHMPWLDIESDSSIFAVVETTRYLSTDQIDQYFARVDEDGDASWYLTDHLGSVREIVDDAGATIAELNYDPYGNHVGAIDPDADRFMFTGREFDVVTGLYYYRARFYDPQSGRFLSEDPIGLLNCASNDTNLYRYVGNSPLTHTDPKGLFWQRLGQIVLTQTDNTLYGKYCGPQFPNRPDASKPGAPDGENTIDKVCKKHDKCYSDADAGALTGEWIPYLGDTKTKDCDAKFCEEMAGTNCQTDPKVTNKTECELARSTMMFWFCEVKGGGKR